LWLKGFGVFWLIAEVLIAECLFSKIVQRTTFSLWSESLTLPFVRFSVKQKALQKCRRTLQIGG